MENTLQIPVTVKDGWPCLTEANRRAISGWCSNKEGRRVIIKIVPHRNTRSLSQNKRYWAILAQIAYQTKNTSEDLHLAFKDRFLPRKFITIGTAEIEVNKTTTDLNAKEFNEYVDQIIACVADFGVIVDAEV